MSDGLRPFFSYYGGKWRAAPGYPGPHWRTIIEPFAGAAGYSTRHPDRDVVLVEIDPVVAGLWRWLIAATAAEVRALPLLVDGQSVSDLDVSEPARALIGFWINKGATRPGNTPSTWFRGGSRANSFWGVTIRERIASQVERIKHWTVIEGSYDCAPDSRATWFIDPPYQGKGVYYRHSSKALDFQRLGEWCRSRRGQVMVCEQAGADWLPFKAAGSQKANPSRNGTGVSAEVLWFSS